MPLNDLFRMGNDGGSAFRGTVNPDQARQQPAAESTDLANQLLQRPGQLRPNAQLPPVQQQAPRNPNSLGAKWDRFENSLVAGADVITQPIEDNGPLGVFGSAASMAGAIANVPYQAVTGEPIWQQFGNQQPTVGQQMGGAAAPAANAAWLQQMAQQSEADGNPALYQSAVAQGQAAQWGMAGLAAQNDLINQGGALDHQGIDLQAAETMAKLNVDEDKLNYLINSSNPRDREFAQRYLGLQQRLRANQRGENQFQRDVTERGVKSSAIAKGAMHFPGRKWGLDDAATQYQLTDTNIGIDAGKDTLGYDQTIGGLDDQLFNANVDYGFNQQQQGFAGQNTSLQHSNADLNLSNQLLQSLMNGIPLQQSAAEAAALAGAYGPKPLYGHNTLDPNSWMAG